MAAAPPPAAAAPPDSRLFESAPLPAFDAPLDPPPPQ